MSEQFKLLLIALILMLSFGNEALAQGTDEASSADSEVKAKTANENTSSNTVAEADPVPDSNLQDINWMRSLSGEQVTSLSDAELVALIRRSIEADQEYLEELTKELEDPDSPYDRAEKAFGLVDERLQALKADLEQAEQEADEEQVARLKEQVEDLEPIRDLVQERFDLAIERRLLLRRMVPLVESRIAHSQIMLGRSIGDIEALPEPAKQSEPVAPPTAPEGEAEAKKPTSSPAIGLFPPGFGPQATEAEAEAGPTEAESTSPTLLSEEYVLADGDVKRWEGTLQEMNQSVLVIEERLATIDQSLEVERDLQNNARRMLDNAEAMRGLFSERFQARTLAGAPDEELIVLREAHQEAVQLSQEARERSRGASDRLARLTEARGYVLEALASRKKDAELAQVELDNAQRRVARISNPFHPRNMFRWFLDHGPNILAILVGMIGLYFILQILGSRVVRAIADRGCRGSEVERKGRANTLVNAFRQAATLAVIVGGILMILEEAGIPIGPLLGGAAVIGLAVAFGAQNLIQDFFQGFMILLENQYKLNDVVMIGDHSGLVEQITLRTTVLRSLDGTLHFIPNGKIEAVSNMTHGWSRALFDLPVAYKEDADRVIGVILEVCKELRNDFTFGPLILEDATMLGVDDFADSAVVIKFFIKTIPLQQWTIRREFLRRIKKRFDAEGIEIPFPHRTVYHRSANGGSMEQALGEAFASNGLGHSQTN